MRKSLQQIKDAGKPSARRMAKMRPAFRTVLFWVHLILGLTVASPICVMCVTGVILAYKIRIETWVDLHGVNSTPPLPRAQALTVECLIEATRKSPGMEPESITVYRDPTRPVEVALKGVAGPVYLDAYSGRVIGGHSRAIHQFFEKVMAWHLSLGVSGPHSSQFRALAGGANAGALLLIIVGIFLWIPRRWNWPHLRAVVLPACGAAGRARDFNWHNVAGIWSAVPLLVIVGTGVAMSYSWASRLSDRPIARARIAARQYLRASNAHVSGLDSLFSRAKQQSAGWKFVTIYLPRDDSDPVHFAIGMKEYIGFGAIAGLALDRTGAVVYFTPAGAAGLSTSTFTHYGHTGEAWGVTGQTVAAVTSFGGVVLVWTGIALSFRRWRSSLARRPGIGRMSRSSSDS